MRFSTVMILVVCTLLAGCGTPGADSATRRSEYATIVDTYVADAAVAIQKLEHSLNPPTAYDTKWKLIGLRRRIPLPQDRKQAVIFAIADELVDRVEDIGLKLIAAQSRTEVQEEVHAELEILRFGLQMIELELEKREKLLLSGDLTPDYQGVHGRKWPHEELTSSP